jgi:hypothetical protein
MRSATATLLTLVLIAPLSARAQAWSYPSFQPPRLTPREYNFGMADAGAPGTALVFQWREQTGPRHQFSFDVGIADPDGADLVLFGGVQGATRLVTASRDVPLDFLLTGGLYAAIGDHTRFRLPVGVSMGHRFALEGDMAVTAYGHPRISLDLCNGCGDSSDLGVAFDLGANLELSRTLAVRVSGLFSGGDSFYDEGFGVSLAWTPAALAGRTATQRRR